MTREPAHYSWMIATVVTFASAIFASDDAIGQCATGNCGTTPIGRYYPGYSTFAFLPQIGTLCWRPSQIGCAPVYRPCTPCPRPCSPCSSPAPIVNPYGRPPQIGDGNSITTRTARSRRVYDTQRRHSHHISSATDRRAQPILRRQTVQTETHRPIIQSRTPNGLHVSSHDAAKVNALWFPVPNNPAADTPLRQRVLTSQR